MENLIYIPGICAGHSDHPELLWVFHAQPTGRLHFKKIEIDFPEPADAIDSIFRKFDVDMSQYQGCPYCEAALYYFCKRCKNLSCFSWEQISDAHHWTCHACQSIYKMKPKTSPFRIEAQIGTANSVTSHASTETGQFRTSPKKGFTSTQMWHPKKG